MTAAVGIDDATNRSTHIPDGAWLKRINVQIRCTAIPSGVTKFQAILWRRPGGHALSGPIAAYFATTDPMTEAALEIRRFKLHGPLTITKAANDFTAMRATLRWRGNIKVRDGDDFLVTVLQSSGGNLDFQTNVLVGFKN